MPRSNKKKRFLTPQPKHPPSPSSQPLTSFVISSLLAEERNLMKARAISSGRKHGLNLQPGSSNPGRGDCAFESVIQNNNDRNCFREKFPLSIGYYRRMWATDMANRTVDTDWNIYSRQEWMNGWEEMMIPGKYKAGIFVI